MIANWDTAHARYVHLLRHLQYATSGGGSGSRSSPSSSRASSGSPGSGLAPACNEHRPARRAGDRRQPAARPARRLGAVRRDRRSRGCPLRAFHRLARADDVRFDPRLVILVMLIVGGRSVSGVVLGATMIAVAERVPAPDRDRGGQAGLPRPWSRSSSPPMMILRPRGCSGRRELDELLVRGLRKRRRRPMLLRPKPAAPRNGGDRDGRRGVDSAEKRRRSETEVNQSEGKGGRSVTASQASSHLRSWRLAVVALQSAGSPPRSRRRAGGAAVGDIQDRLRREHHRQACFYDPIFARA